MCNFLQNFFLSWIKTEWKHYLLFEMVSNGTAGTYELSNMFIQAILHDLVSLQLWL